MSQRLFCPTEFVQLPGRKRELMERSGPLTRGEVHTSRGSAESAPIGPATPVNAFQGLANHAERMPAASVQPTGMRVAVKFEGRWS